MYSADGSTTGTYTPRLFKDGTLISTYPTPPAPDGWGGSFNLSGYGTSTEETCDCEIAEVLLYDHQLTDGERGQVEDYLYEKWFAVAPPTTGYVKVWSGTAWDLKPVKVWNGSTWVTKQVKYWNGSAWVDA
jgi:hypothetical protein